MFSLFTFYLKLKPQVSKNFSWQEQCRPFCSLQRASLTKRCVTALGSKALCVEFMNVLVAGATHHCCAPESSCIASPSPTHQQFWIFGNASISSLKFVSALRMSSSWISFTRTVFLCFMQTICQTDYIIVVNHRSMSKQLWHFAKIYSSSSYHCLIFLEIRL